MPFSKVSSDLDLFYLAEGEGKQTLLFIHGWTCDSNDWLSQFPHFASRYRIVAADNRGHGRSSVTAGGYEARVFASDLIALLDHLGVDRVVAVGHSLGALIASAMAVEYPDRIDGVVSIDAAYGSNDEEAARFLTLVEASQGPDGVDHVAALFDVVDSPSTPAFFRELHRRRVFSTASEVVLKTFADLNIGVDPLVARARTESYLSGRTCPTLSIWSGSRTDPAAWESDLVRDKAKSKVMHVPLGHWPHHDAPAMVNQVIDEWLESLNDG